MTRRQTELLHGTLETMILRVLADRRDHGYGVGRRIEEALADAQPIEDGSLYPALYRLERRRLIRGAWGMSDARRRARYYELTAAGHRELARRTGEWSTFAARVSRLLLDEG
jgi:PadR family transcriptional regulator PadR